VPAALTRFGSSLASPQSAAGVLRARAARLGVTLTTASPLDLAAAAIGADLWMLATGSLDLERAPGSDGAAEALAKVMLRAAGHPSPPRRRSGPPPPVCSDTQVSAAVSGYLEWAEHHVGADAGEALRRAAADLSCGRLAPFAEVLVLTADAEELLRRPS
jgi:hypothetical protein